MEIKEYLIKDYELKVRFLTDHFSRMWTLFNFFRVTETAIVSGRVIFATPDKQSFALLWLGLIVSIIWYLMSAQDRYLVNLYRQELRETFRQLTLENGFQDSPLAPLYHVGQMDEVDLKEPGVKSSPLSWRMSPIGRMAPE